MLQLCHSWAFVVEITLKSSYSFCKCPRCPHFGQLAHLLIQIFTENVWCISNFAAAYEHQPSRNAPPLNLMEIHPSVRKGKMLHLPHFSAVRV